MQLTEAPRLGTQYRGTAAVRTRIRRIRHYVQICAVTGKKIVAPAVKDLLQENPVRDMEKPLMSDNKSRIEERKAKAIELAATGMKRTLKRRRN